MPKRPDYEVAHLSEIPHTPTDGAHGLVLPGEWKQVRHHFGIKEFAANAFVATEAGQEIGLKRYVAWSEGGDAGDPTLEELIASTSSEDLDPPSESGRFVILTSGTTGAPKGAQRAHPDTLGPLAALFSRIPLRSG